jgi:hypothetical protein
MQDKGSASCTTTGIELPGSGRSDALPERPESPALVTTSVFKTGSRGIARRRVMLTDGVEGCGWCVCVCACVCVTERERVREGDRV